MNVIAKTHRPGALADTELAEIKRRRPGVRMSLACEGMHLSAEEEALFAQMDAERLTTDQRAERIRAYVLARIQAETP